MKASLLNAIRHKNLITFPGMTAGNINKFFTESNETQKGHIKKSRQGVRSTKVIDKDTILEAEMHPKPTPGVKIKDVYLGMFDTFKRPCTLINPVVSQSPLPADINTQWWQTN